jgi:hypothetical protein
MSADEPTTVIALVPPMEEPATVPVPVARRIPLRPLLSVMIPTLLMALVVGVTAGRGLAPYLGAAIGVTGAAVALRRALA